MSGAVTVVTIICTTLVTVAAILAYGFYKVVQIGLKHSNNEEDKGQERE